MKIKIISVLFMFVLSISITACSNNKSTSNQENNGSVSSAEISDISSSSTNEIADINTSIILSTYLVPTNQNIAIQTTLNSNNDSALEAFKAVLQNKAEFFSTEILRSMYLDDFLTNEDIYQTRFEVHNFAVFDMDGDNIPEVVFSLSPGNSTPDYEILHYMNGKVYGYLQVYRGLRRLKADGTFSWSCGARYNGYGRMRFELNDYETDNLGYRKPYNNDFGNISYFIDDKPVTREAYIDFENEQDQKKNVDWYEFSQNNIEAKLSMN